MKFLSKLDFKTILIILLGLIILLMRTCGNKIVNPTQTIYVNGKPYELIKRDTFIEYIPKTTVITKKGKDIYHDTTIYIDVTTPVDTLKILKDYHAKNVYNDTLKLNDSLGSIVVQDTITKNLIFSRKYTAKINEKKTKETIYLKEPKKAQLYVGLSTSVTKTDLFKTIGVSGIYKTKQDKMYQLGFGISNDQMLTPYIQGGLFWKIKLK